MSLKCKTHPTQNATLYCSKPDCHQPLCSACKSQHEHNTIISIKKLQEQTFQAIRDEIKHKMKPDWDRIENSIAYEASLHQTIQNLQPYFVTGNMDHDDVVDHLSNLLKIKCFEQITEQINNALKQTLYPIFKDNSQGSPSITFQEKFFISAQYYHSSPSSYKSCGWRPNSRDWTSKEIEKYIGCAPIFTHVHDSNIQKLPNQDKYLFWNKDLDIICVFSSEEKRFYQVPEKTNAVTLVDLENIYYLVVATEKELSICNLNTNPNETVMIKPEIDIDSDSDAEDEDEEIPKKKKKVGKNKEQKEKKEKDFSFTVNTLKFEQKQELKYNFYMSSCRNKIITVSRQGEVELLEVTQTSQNGPLKFDLLCSFKLEGTPKEVLMDFKSNIFLVITEENWGKSFYIYHLKKADKTPSPFRHLKKVESFKWHGSNKLLLINQSVLYKISKSKLVLLRKFPKLGTPILLTKKGILQGSKNGLRLIPYSNGNESISISLPRDKTAVKKAEEIATRAAEKGAIKESKSCGWDYEAHVGDGRFAGQSVDNVRFLNEEEESLVYVQMNNHYQRNISAPQFNEEMYFDHVDGTIDTNIETRRIFLIE